MTNEELVKEIQLGHEKAHNIELLYLQNKGLINKIALRYKDFHDVDDLQQEGFFGFLTAIDSWDPQGGASFSTYAFSWIEATIHRYINNKGSLIRLPSHRIDMTYRYKTAIRNFNAEHHRDPSHSELASILEVSQKHIERIEQDIRLLSPYSLDKEVFIDEDTPKPKGDFIEDEHNYIDELLDRIQEEDLSNTIWPLVDELKPKESEIIRKRFQDGLTLQSCGDNLGVTRERVRQIEKKALEKLRSPKNLRALSPYIESKTESMAYHATGLGSFSRTWTSAPERVVIFHENMEEKGCQQAL